jgi:hypothetical protein
MSGRSVSRMARPSKADWDGQTRRWHDRHWFHEDADGNPVREYNTLTEKMPPWVIVAVIVLGVLAITALSLWTSRR